MVTVGRWGTFSLAVRIPIDLVRLSGLRVGTVMSVRLMDDGSFVFRPTSKAAQARAAASRSSTELTTSQVSEKW